MRYILTVIFLQLSLSSISQEVGISASFFLPKNGYFSTPISPISIRGIGITLIPNMTLESGITLYRMSGLGVKGLPFESKKPLIGPTFTFMVPLELVLEIGNNNQVIRFKGGGFAFYSLDQKVNAGNLDRALLDYTGWEVLNSNFNVENKLGFGIQFGMEYIVYLVDNFGLSFGGNYYIGHAGLSLNGTMTGWETTSGLQNMVADYPDSEIDYTGLEISVGILFSN